MYSSLRSADLVVPTDTGRCAVQTDHRTAAETEAQAALSLVFAVARARNPVRFGLAERVQIAFDQPQPEALVLFCSGAGAEVLVGNTVVAPANPKPDVVDPIVADALAQLGQRALADAGGDLQALEARAATVPRDDESLRWDVVVTVGAAVGERIRSTDDPAARWAPDADGVSTVPYVLVLGNGGVLNVFRKVEKFLDHGVSEAPSKLLGLVADRTVAEGPLFLDFRPADWSGRTVSLLAADLLPGAAGAEIPLVAVVMDLPNSVRTLPAARAPERHALVAEALRNLASLAVAVDPLPIGGVPALIVHGSHYACEKLLDPVFMATLHERLAAPRLLVGLPEKGGMAVIDGSQPPDALAAFAADIRARRGRAAPAGALSGDLFVVEEGRPVAVHGRPPARTGWFARWFGQPLRGSR